MLTYEARKLSTIEMKMHSEVTNTKKLQASAHKLTFKMLRKLQYMEELINPSCLYDVENNLALCSFKMVLFISDEIMTEIIRCNRLQHVTSKGCSLECTKYIYIYIF